MAPGSSYTFQITANSGWAVDVITVNGVPYVNNGVDNPPPLSTWASVTLENITADSSLNVTFAISTDDDGVADKYKHVVTAVAGSGGSVDPEKQVVYDGSTAEISIIPDENMAVDTIVVQPETGESQEYVNNGQDD